MSKILPILLDAKVLQDYDYNIFLDVSSLHFYNGEPDIPMDIVITKEDSVIAYFIDLCKKTFDTTIVQTRENSAQSEQRKFEHLQRQIANTPLESIPHFINTTLTNQTLEDSVLEFLNNCYDGANVPRRLIEYLDYAALDYEYPTLDFVPFLKEQMLISSSDDVTAFGKDRGVMKYYMFDVARNCFSHTFGILHLFDDRFEAVYNFSNPGALSLDDKIGKARTLSRVPLNRIDTFYKRSANVALKDLFGPDKMTLHALLDTLALYDPNPPETYSEAAYIVDQMFHSPYLIKSAKRALRLLVQTIDSYS